MCSLNHTELQKALIEIITRVIVLLKGKNQIMIGTNQLENKVIDTKEEISLKELIIIEALKKVNNPFRNWTVQEVMKDLKVSESTSNMIFKRADFPSVNIGKTKTVTLLAYLIWKMERKENESNENSKT